MNVLEVRDLDVTFGKSAVIAVKGVTLDVMENETLCIIGESGSGKSTTAFAMLGLLPKSASVSGSIKYQDQELVGRPERDMVRIRGKKIAMIFQEPMTSLNPVMTVGSQITESLLQHKSLSSSAAYQEALKLLEVVKIPDPKMRLRQYPHELSGGMRQRVMIAMALSSEPEVLIADEPTTALDVTIQAEILELLKDVQRDRGLSVVFITHDLGVVAQIASRVVVMLKGEIVEAGDVRQVFNAPAHPYTKSLLSAALRADTIKLTDGSAAQQGSGEVLLEVKGVSKIYPGARPGLFKPRKEIHAVRGISFRLHKGETLGVIGESGSGKTTLSRCILNLVRPTTGEIRFQGKVISEQSEAAWRTLREKVQIVFQDPYSSLNPRLSIGRALAEPLKVHKGLAYNQALPTVKALLAEVGLPEEAVDRYPHEFSGGQRQRIVIARSLVLEPDLIIADEAVSALDVTIQAQILKLLKEIQARRGLSFIFVTHDMAVLRDFCDRAIVMYQGQVVEEGDVEEMFQAPKAEYTRKLRDAAPIPEVV
ncbi:MAG: ABC transporter ATP-binding protein [Pseudomonadota bacterium]